MSTHTWAPIRKRAIKAATELGHNVLAFDKKRSDVRMANCQTCYGCCWISHSPTRGFAAGGRILKYKCGTKEAMGIL